MCIRDRLGPVTAPLIEKAARAELGEVPRGGGLAQVQRFHNGLRALLAVLGQVAQDAQAGIIGQGAQADGDFGAG